MLVNLNLLVDSIHFSLGHGLHVILMELVDHFQLSNLGVHFPLHLREELHDFIIELLEDGGVLVFEIFQDC